MKVGKEYMIQNKSKVQLCITITVAQLNVFLFFKQTFILQESQEVKISARSASISGANVASAVSESVVWTFYVALGPARALGETFLRHLNENIPPRRAGIL